MRLRLLWETSPESLGSSMRSLACSFMFNMVPAANLTSSTERSRSLMLRGVAGANVAVQPRPTLRVKVTKPKNPGGVKTELGWLWITQVLSGCLACPPLHRCFCCCLWFCVHTRDCQGYPPCGCMSTKREVQSFSLNLTVAILNSTLPFFTMLFFPLFSTNPPCIC